MKVILRCIKCLLVGAIVVIFSCEDKKWDNPYDAKTTLDPSEWAPNNLVLQALTDAKVKLAWQHERKLIEGFVVDRKTDNGSYQEVAKVAKDSLTYTDDGLSTRFSYTYQVRAYSGKNYSDYSNEKSITTTFGAPSNIQLQVINDNSIIIIWQDNSTYETGFNIQKKIGNGDYIHVATVGENINEYTDTPLVFEVVYAYRVQAKSEYNESDWVYTQNASTSFPTPSNLIIAPLTDSEIELTWTDNCSFEEGYRIERQADDGNWIQIADLAPNITQYTNTGLSYGPNYTYRLYAYTTSNQSNFVTSSSTSTSFPGPSNFTATAQNDTDILLEWEDNCSFEEGYKIERQEDGGSWTQFADLAADVTQYTNAGLSYGPNYTYRLYAYTTSNQSGYATSNTTSTSFPGPTNLTATAQNDTDILLEWEDNCSFEEGYRIEQQEDGGSWTQIADLAPNITQYTDAGLSYGLNYTYRVYAYTSSNQSGYATSNSTSTNLPDTPTNLTTTAQNDTDILLEWMDNCSFEEGYRIERQEDSGNWTQIADLVPNITQYTDSGLSYGPNYTYRVYAYTASNQSGYETSNSTSTSFPEPTNLTATAQNDTTILLEWIDNCSFEEGYRIERQEDGGSWTQIADLSADVTQYIDTGLSYGPNYTYRVYAYTTSNQFGYATSNTTSTSFPGPTNLTTTAQNDTDILLEWVDNCSFEEGYRIERQEDGGNWTQIAELAADVTQYTDVGWTYGSINTYRLYGFTLNNTSYYSNTDSILLINDIDGNVYKCVKIGTQWWMAENLNVAHYSNGNTIPNVTDSTTWNNLTTGAYGEYDNNGSNATIYGKLYNWYAVDDSRNIAPTGWHVPSDTELQTLADFLGSVQVAGGKMKEVGFAHWDSPNTGATNESGFTGLAGGYRPVTGGFDRLGYWGIFWTATEYDAVDALNRSLIYNTPVLNDSRDYKRQGCSVRCLKD